jgi:hypothetical protein
VRRDPGKRIRKQFGPGYRLILTAQQADALLDVLETLAVHHRPDWRTKTHVRDPDVVRAKMIERQVVLGEKIIEIAELALAMGDSRSKLKLGAVPVTVDQPPVAPNPGVTLGRWELRAINVYPRDDFAWAPSNQRQRDQWDAHFSLMFNTVGALYLDLGRERLRMAAGKPTRCRLCNEPVLPPSGSHHTVLGGESAIPVRATLCLSCIKKQLGKRAGEWDRMSDNQREQFFLPRLQELGRRGPLP